MARRGDNQGRSKGGPWESSTTASISSIRIERAIDSRSTIPTVETGSRWPPVVTNRDAGPLLSREPWQGQTSSRRPFFSTAWACWFKTASRSGASVHAPGSGRRFPLAPGHGRAGRTGRLFEFTDQSQGLFDNQGFDGIGKADFQPPTWQQLREKGRTNVSPVATLPVYILHPQIIPLHPIQLDREV